MAKRELIVFSGDMSAERYSSILSIPEGTKSADIDIAWPATGTPAGALTFQESLHGDPSGDWQAYSRDGSTTLTITVAGTASAVHLRDMEITGPRKFRAHWVPTSGGTGANFYDGSSNASASPIVLFV